MAYRSLARVEKKARQERRKLVFIDESGFYLLPALVRTYAPCGETPILKVFQTNDHLSVMSGITLTGQLFTLIRDEALTSCESVLFLKHLLHALSDKLLVIWDGSPIHRGVEVKEFSSDGGAPHVHLERLPPYAPDLNPDEGVWDLLKYVELRNVCCLNLSHLHDELRACENIVEADLPLGHTGGADVNLAALSCPPEVCCHGHCPDEASCRGRV